MSSEKKERLIPICGWCKKIKNDDNYWEQLEIYLTIENATMYEKIKNDYDNIMRYLDGAVMEKE